jgi:hypothetical protein
MEQTGTIQQTEEPTICMRQPIAGMRLLLKLWQKGIDRQINREHGQWLDDRGRNL